MQARAQTGRRMRKGESLVARVRHGRKLGFWFGLAVLLLRPWLMVFTKRDWQGGEHLHPGGAVPGPSGPGIVVTPNHISWFDPLVMAHFLYDNGRPPRLLGKEAVFRIPVLGRIIVGAGQIPVHRESRDAGAAVASAVSAVRAGECVVVYPEGTITRDPDLWPMQGKTGAARIALATGAPVIPVAQWGPQDVMAPYTKHFRLLPRKTMHVRAGAPVDLSDLAGRPLDAATLRIATDRITTSLTELLAEVRGEPVPTTVRPRPALLSQEDQ